MTSDFFLMNKFLPPPEIASREQHENKNPQDVFKIVMTLTLIEPSRGSPLTFEPQKRTIYLLRELQVRSRMP